jgi:hypothetical protein
MDQPTSNNENGSSAMLIMSVVGCIPLEVLIDAEVIPLSFARVVIISSRRDDQRSPLLPLPMKTNTRLLIYLQQPSILYRT